MKFCSSRSLKKVLHSKGSAQPTLSHFLFMRAAAAQTESGLGTTQCIKRGQFAWHKHLLRSSSSSSSSNSYYESSAASIVHHVLHRLLNARPSISFFRETQQQTFTQATTTIIECSLLLYDMCLHVHGQSCFVS